MKLKMTVLFCMLIVSLLTSGESRPKDEKDIQITAWSCAFESVSSGGTRILIEPFSREPGDPDEFKAVTLQTECLLLTHSHGDHLGDAIELPKPARPSSSP